MSKKTCPCGQDKAFLECCEPYILETLFPDTPELLMRSRYSAYTVANINYIEKTMCGPASQHFSREDSLRWATGVVWLGLEVLSSSVTANGQSGEVEFIARFMQKGECIAMRERSVFQKNDGRWYYCSAKSHADTVESKVGRNDSCPCGSGKKFKKCHLS